jgi:hypothetical protein
MPASRNSLDQRAISSPADLNFPQLLLQQGAECSGSSGFSFISDCCPSLSPRREKSGLAFFPGNDLAIWPIPPMLKNVYSLLRGGTHHSDQI